MNTNQTTGGNSAAVYFGSTFVPQARWISYKSCNTQTTGTRYAVYSAAAATGLHDHSRLLRADVALSRVARPTLRCIRDRTGRIRKQLILYSFRNRSAYSDGKSFKYVNTDWRWTYDIDCEPRCRHRIGADAVAGGVPMPGTLQFSSPTFIEKGGTATSL